MYETTHKHVTKRKIPVLWLQEVFIIGKNTVLFRMVITGHDSYVGLEGCLKMSTLQLPLTNPSVINIVNIYTVNIYIIFVKITVVAEPLL